MTFLSWEFGNKQSGTYSREHEQLLCLKKDSVVIPGYFTSCVLLFDKTSVCQVICNIRLVIFTVLFSFQIIDNADSSDQSGFTMPKVFFS